MKKESKHSGWGGARPGNGRKPTGVRRVYFGISCQPEERDEVMRLARESGKSISRFVLDRIFGESRMIY